MPKLPIISGDDMMHVLKKEGFLQISIKGSHHKRVKPNIYGKLVTIVPRHKELDQMTLKSILKQSNISQDILLSYL